LDKVTCDWDWDAVVQEAIQKLKLPYTLFKCSNMEELTHMVASQCVVNIKPGQELVREHVLDEEMFAILRTQYSITEKQPNKNWYDFPFVTPHEKGFIETVRAQLLRLNLPWALFGEIKDMRDWLEVCHSSLTTRITEETLTRLLRDEYEAWQDENRS